MKDNKWLRLLTYVTGLVNQELLLQNEYSAAEDKILRAHLPARQCLSDRRGLPSPRSASYSGARRWRRWPNVAKPDTILAWYRSLIAQNFDGSKNHESTVRLRC